MEPRSFDRGKISDLVTRQNEAITLQWSRDRLIAESDGTFPAGATLGTSFNGAAIV